MTDADAKAFSDALAALGVAFGAVVDTPVRQAYWLFLRDLELPAFLRAVDAAGKTLKWFPKPAELRELAGDNPKARAAEAWDAVLVAMRVHDYTTGVDFGPLVNAVIHNLGGWVWLCNRSVRDLTFDRKKFEELYAAFASKPPEQLPRTAPLRGAFEGKPVRIAIGGKEPPRQVTGKRPEVAEVVRRLADEKGKP